MLELYQELFIVNLVTGPVAENEAGNITGN